MSRLDADLEFLNDGFIGRMWPFATEVIRSQVLHDAWYDVAEVEPFDGDFRPVRLAVSGSTVDIEGPPRFDESGRAAIRLRFFHAPEDLYDFTGRIHLRGSNNPLTRFHVTVTFFLGIDIGEDGPLDPVTHVDITTDKRGKAVSALGGDWEEEVRATIEQRIEHELRFLTSASYAPPERLPDLQLVHPDVADDPPSAINLVLVADRFDGPAQLQTFDEIVEALIDELDEPRRPGSTEPFHSFKTAVRIWRLELPPDRPVVESYRSGGSRKVAFGNLGRLAAVGRLADAEGTNVVAYLAHRDELPAGTRAMAMGNVVMLPTKGTAEKSVNLLLHELGHTIVGDLADEYFDDDPNDDDRDRRYRGPDPGAANLATPVPIHRAPGSTRPDRFPSWRRWLDEDPELPDWDQHPVEAVEGGGYFAEAIYRPARECKMRDTTASVPFCAVCREAITRKLRHHLGDDWVLLEIAHPGRDAEPVLAHVRARGRHPKLVHHVPVRPDGTTDVEVTVIGGSLPEPWTLEPILRGDGEIRRSRTDHRQRPGRPTPPVPTWELAARFGDVLEVQLASACPFTPWDELPSYTLEVRCDRPLLDADPRPPSVPTELEVRGRLLAGLHAELSAQTEDPNGDDVRIEFEVIPADTDPRGRVDARSRWTPWSAEGPVTATASRQIDVEGHYRVRARAVDRTDARSGWSPFERFTVHPRTGGGGGGGIGGGKGGDGGIPPHRP